jgi:hypothetical protein
MSVAYVCAIGEDYEGSSVHAVTLDVIKAKAWLKEQYDEHIKEYLTPMPEASVYKIDNEWESEEKEGENYRAGFHYGCDFVFVYGIKML